MVNLKFGACKMAVAGPIELSGKLDYLNNKRVATKYPNIAKDYFQNKKGQTIEIIKLNGSVELAPLVGLSEVIVDIVESGKTLKENGLVVLEEICDLSARLVVNRVSMKMEKDRIMDIVEKVKRKIQEE
jgi:ATP phosphoribosyltransferase